MDPEILDVRGKQIDIAMWRDTDNVFEATLLKADGTALPLTDYDVTFAMVDRLAGTVKALQTNAPGQHVSTTKTRFLVSRAVFAGLTGVRPYTWKYQIMAQHRTTRQITPFFWGDVRVHPPAAPPLSGVIQVSAAEAVGVADDQAVAAV